METGLVFDRGDGDAIHPDAVSKGSVDSPRQQESDPSASTTSDTRSRELLIDCEEDVIERHHATMGSIATRSCGRPRGGCVDLVFWGSVR